MVSCDDFIKYNQINNIEINESSTSVSQDSKKFYDIINKHNSKNVIIYSAKFKIFEKEPLMYTYKLSGTKANEITEEIFDLYKCIEKWRKFKNIQELYVDSAFVVSNRLYLGADVTINLHMENNMAFNVTWQ